LANDSGRIADCDNIGGQVADDDRARAHDRVITDGYPRTNDHATALRSPPEFPQLREILPQLSVDLFANWSHPFFERV
jgi:hypothetical protein